jgi:hypothetical protein
MMAKMPRNTLDRTISTIPLRPLAKRSVFCESILRRSDSQARHRVGFRAQEWNLAAEMVYSSVTVRIFKYTAIIKADGFRNYSPRE